MPGRVSRAVKQQAEDRGVRGGNWNDTANNLESSNRNNNPTNENNNIGFRVAGPWTRPAVTTVTSRVRP